MVTSHRTALAPIDPVETQMSTPTTLERLDLATATGVWRIEGLSGTNYSVDADSSLAMRQPAPGSATGAYDGCWISLINVRNGEGEGVVTVGMRHYWDFDPAPGEPGVTVWWLQSSVAAIVHVDQANEPKGRAPAPDEDARPFSPPVRPSEPGRLLTHDEGQEHSQGRLD